MNQTMRFEGPLFTSLRDEPPSDSMSSDSGSTGPADKELPTIYNKPVIAFCPCNHCGKLDIWLTSHEAALEEVAVQFKDKKIVLNMSIGGMADIFCEDFVKKNAIYKTAILQHGYIGSRWNFDVRSWCRYDG